VEERGRPTEGGYNVVSEERETGNLRRDFGASEDNGAITQRLNPTTVSDNLRKPQPLFLPLFDTLRNQHELWNECRSR
jgi:hypothetical protein